MTFTAIRLPSPLRLQLTVAAAPLCREFTAELAIEPYAVDGVKCISYQTLENRGDVPEEMKRSPPSGEAGIAS